MYMHLELRGKRAGELSYLLDKNPDRLFEWEVNGSMVRVFFPIYQPDVARAAVIYWPDPWAAGRFSKGSPGRNEHLTARAFAIDSLFVSALEVAFGMHRARGRSDGGTQGGAHDLEIALCPVCTYLGTDRILGLFEPLGYEVSLRELPGVDVDLATRRPRLFEITLHGTQVVEVALRQVIAMILVMDSDRHEYMTQEDIERLGRLGAGWLDDHPERPFIVSRFLLYRRLIDAFIQRARRGTDAEVSQDGYDASGEPRPQRITPEAYRTDELVKFFMRREGRGARLLVVGARDPRLVVDLVSANLFGEVLVVDPSLAQLDRLRRKIERSGRYSDILSGPRTNVAMQVSALGYRDARLEGFDVALLAGVVEHIPPERVARAVAPLFEQWRPLEVVMTVPNRAFAARGHDRNGRRNGIDSERAGDLVDVCRTAGDGAGYRSSVESLGDEQHAPSPFVVISFVRGEGQP